MNSFGENIKACREKRHLSQRELAMKLRVGMKKIEEYESGLQVPSNKTLLRLSTILDIPTSELIGKKSTDIEQQV